MKTAAASGDSQQRGEAADYFGAGTLFDKMLRNIVTENEEDRSGNRGGWGGGGGGNGGDGGGGDFRSLQTQPICVTVATICVTVATAYIAACDPGASARKSSICVTVGTRCVTVVTACICCVCFKLSPPPAPQARARGRTQAHAERWRCTTTQTSSDCCNRRLLSDRGPGVNHYPPRALASHHPGPSPPPNPRWYATDSN